MIEHLDDVTINAVKACATEAQCKHPDNNMFSDIGDLKKLPILGEEFGEVCTAMTYDTPDDKDNLVRELLQLSANAAMWAQKLG